MMSAASAESFLREQGEDFGWQGVAALKSHVDHLVRSDLNAAAELCERIDQLSQLAGGGSREPSPTPRARAFCITGEGTGRRTSFTRRRLKC